MFPVNLRGDQGAQQSEISADDFKHETQKNLNKLFSDVIVAYIESRTIKNY